MRLDFLFEPEAGSAVRVCLVGVFLRLIDSVLRGEIDLGNLFMIISNCASLWDLVLLTLGL